MKGRLKLTNYRHITLVKELKKKLNRHRKGQKGGPKILYGSIDFLTEGWPREDIEILIARVKVEIDTDPLSIDGLVTSDGIRHKLWKHLPRGGISQRKASYLKRFTDYELPVAVAANVWRIDLGMQNNPENHKALAEAGLQYPVASDSSKHFRIGSLALTPCTVGIKITSKDLVRNADGGYTFKGPLAGEIIVIPNTIADLVIGEVGRDGQRRTDKVPKCWQKYHETDLERAKQRGKTRTPTPNEIKAKARTSDQRKGESVPPPQDADLSDAASDGLLEKYDYLRVKELRQMCRESKLSPGGKKADLIKRLAEAGRLPE